MLSTRRQFIAGAAALLAVRPARAMTNPAFVWTQLNNTNLPFGDGLSSCVLNGKMYSVGGWDPTNLSHNRVSFGTNGSNWTESAVSRTWTGRHGTPLIVSGGKMRLIGGDTDSGSYEPNEHSWDGLESSPWTAEPNFDPLKRLGHWALGDFHGYDWFGGGQTMTPLSGTPTKFFTDRWRRPAGTTDPWELYDDDCALGARAFLGKPVVIGSVAYFVCGGTYQTSDYPARSYRNDIMAMGADFKIRCVLAKSQMPGMIFHSVEELGGYLIIVAGHNGVNLKTVWAFNVSTREMTQLADFPGPATHAATLQKFNGSLYLWGGLNGGQQAWRLDLVDQSKIHHGAMATSSVTNMTTEYSLYDLSNPLTPGETIRFVGLFLNGSRQVRPRIGYRSAPGVFDTAWRSATTSLHPGGSTYADFPVGDFLVPGPGYYAGFTMTYGPGTPDAFVGGAYTRAQCAGDVTGNGVAFSELGDGVNPMRWTRL